MRVDANLNSILKTLDMNTRIAVEKHLNNCVICEKSVLTIELESYINLLSEPENYKDNTSALKNLSLIRSDLCKRLNYYSANQFFLCILSLIKSLIKDKIFNSNLKLPNRSFNYLEYDSYRNTSNYNYIRESFPNHQSAREIFEKIINYLCPKNIEQCIKEFINNCPKENKFSHRRAVIDFLTSISLEDLKWYENPSIINTHLKMINEKLNSQPMERRPTSKSEYIKIINFIEKLMETNLLHKNTTLPRYISRQSKEVTIKKQSKNDYKDIIEKRIISLSKHLKNDIHEAIKKYIDNRNINQRKKSELTKDLYTYISLFSQLCKNENKIDYTKSLEYIYISLSETYAIKSTQDRFNEILNLLKYLSSIELIKSNNSIASIQINPLEIKSKNIPESVRSFFNIKKTANEELEETLIRCCTKDIANRLNEFVKSYKERERKSYRKPLRDFLNQIYLVRNDWYLSSTLIQQELINFRDKQLKELNRNTTYKNFQNLKSSFSTLKEHGLIPHDTNLPKSLKRTSKIGTHKKENSLILHVDLYDESKKTRYIDSPTFIKDIETELSDNLEELLKSARKIVFSGYKKYLMCSDIISKSNRDEFIKNPNLTVKYKKQLSDEIVDFNPFHKLHPLYLENRIAYYDLFFEQIIRGDQPHKISGLDFSKNITEFFGLTPLISSAMQIIITEELGFNAHPLYLAKISSNRKGMEFIQVNDEGGIRVKVVKPRAKKTRKFILNNSEKILYKIREKDIDASTCIKMALEMGKRTRESLQSDHLWTCIKNGGNASLPDSSTFQCHFNYIRKKSYESSGYKALLTSTLKKVRCSKGVLLYLRSNGDILKTSAYYGNHVSTALKNYVPEYLAEIIYRIKIRSFQNIMLYMSISQDQNPEKILGINESEFQSILKKAFKNPDMGGTLYDKLSINKKKFNNQKIKYFCISTENIIIAANYAKSGQDPKLKEDCKNVIIKISEGPIIMKQMLRNALKN